VDSKHIPELPDGAWDGYDFTSVHVATLVADLAETPQIADALAPRDYDKLVNRFQRMVLELVESLRDEGMAVGEVHLHGCSLHILFYDAAEVERNYALDGHDPLKGRARNEMIAACRASNENLSINALKAAIRLKNRWLIEDVNLLRVRAHFQPHRLAIGVHAGRAFLINRVYGARRIEGHAIDMVNHVQQHEERALYSGIMVSQKARDTILRAVVKHTQLRQRVFFHEHELDERTAPDNPIRRVAELKFYHRIGIHVPGEVIEQYEAIFALDRANAWAYYQLVDHYAHEVKNWTRVFQLVKAALIVRPCDEKVHLDMAKYYLHIGKLDQSRQCAEEALRINEAFDLALEHLAVVAARRNTDEEVIACWRRAVALCPGSPVNNYNLGLALLDVGMAEEGFHFVQEALHLYPGYKDWQVFRETLLSLKQEGKLPELLEGYLEPSDDDE